jgi:hypothetical protein
MPIRYASLTQIERVIGVPRVEVEEAATRLQSEGAIDVGASIDGLPAAWLVWKE